MRHLAAREVLDGLMLGDGGLWGREGGARYYVNMSKHTISLEDHLKYEQWIADNVFASLGIAVCEGYPKVNSNQKAYLVTHQSPFLTDLYVKWYTGGEWVGSKYNERLRGATKVLPGYLMQATELPILTLVHWFLGDGSSSWNHPELNARLNVPVVLVSFSTHSFSEKEVYHLISILNNMGLNTTKPYKAKRVKKGSGLLIYLAQDSVDHFMDLVTPHMLEIFGDSVSPSYLDMVKFRGDL